MGEHGRPEVWIWRRTGSPGASAGAERVRWAYAAFVPERDLEQHWAGLIAANGDRSAVLRWLQELPAQCVLTGGEIREIAQRDPELRRALRDARQMLRNEGKAVSRRMAGDGET